MSVTAIRTAPQSHRIDPLRTQTAFPRALGMVLTLPAQVLLFSMLVFPATRDLLYVKAALLAVVLVMICFRTLVKGRLALDSAVGRWTLFLVAVGLFFVLRGIQNKTPGAMAVAQVYLLWPLVYTVLICGLTSWRMFIWVQRILVFATICIGLYGSVFVLTDLGILPGFMYVELFDQGQGVGLQSGYTRANLHSLNSLPFLLAFVIAAIATYSKEEKSTIVSGKWLWFALSVGTAFSVMSARRGLLLVIAVAPFLTFLFQRLQPRRGKQRTGRLLILPALVIILAGQALYFRDSYGFRVSALVEFFAQGFQFSQAEEIGTYVRREQFYALVAGWSEHPLIGAGIGAAAPGSVRDPLQPWAYELYYLSLLYQTGLAGILAYTAGIAWIYWVGIKIVREGGPIGNTMLSVLVGMTCFLAIGATNPILPTFDALWVIFLPVGLVNFWLRNRSKRSPMVAVQFASQTTGGISSRAKAVRGKQ